MFVVMTAAGCMEGPGLFRSGRTREAPPPVDIHVAKPPPVTPEQVTAANASAAAQALQDELTRAAESRDPAPARK